jgi:tetratricopeptide (TPR) repeat protein
MSFVTHARPFALAAILVLAMLPLATPAVAALAPDADRLLLADSLYTAGRWADAAPIYREMTVAAPEVARHWARYGACLHNLGIFDDAVRALTRAEAISHNPVVMFNLACALARAGRPDDALDWLTKASQNGFTNAASVESDEDLASLKSHPRWNDVWSGIDRQARPCAYDDRYRQLDFWIGSWDVKTAQGQPAGSSEVEMILNQCIIFENWTGFSGMSGKSFNFIEPGTGSWRQTWVDDKGDVHEYRGEFVDGEMRYRRESRAADGHLVLNRMTFFNLAPGHVRQLGEHSDDDGKTWTVDYDLHYFRRKA